MRLKFNLFLAVLSFSGVIFAQNDTIKTEKLIIVKQYSPTVNDAFKIKQRPSESDSVSTEVKQLNYSFLNVPVASTFTPAKGRASRVILPSKSDSYNNLARLGFGNYTTLLGELYSTFDLNNGKQLDLNFSHLSSQGGIDDLLLDDKYYNTHIDVGLSSETREYAWSGQVHVNHDVYNWYGLPKDFDPANLIDAAEQTYMNLGFEGEVKPLQSSFIRSASLAYDVFSDDFKAMEHDFNFRVDTDLDLGYDDILTTVLEMDYLSTSYGKPYTPLGFQNYSYYNVSLYPKMQFDISGVDLDVGAKIAYSSDIEYSESDFYIYPKVSVNYNLTEDFNIFAGAKGDLDQHTYREFVDENPFVSPNLEIAPTSTSYDIYGGIQGQIDKLNYMVKASYAQHDDYAFFRHNVSAPSNTGVYGFEQNNSFNVVYDDMTQLNLNVALNYTPHEDLDLGFEANYNSYDTDNEIEAWNLPEIDAQLFGHYQFTEQWAFGLTAFFVGERDAYNLAYNPAISAYEHGSRKQDAFVDLNAEVDYKINQQFSVFVRGNNILGSDDARWKNYEVQGIQVLGGLTYKFNW
ncbi:MAG: TonB-dependent receptor domain-containing protein [Flavobacteriaceae bacterium]